MFVPGSYQVACQLPCTSEVPRESQLFVKIINSRRKVLCYRRKKDKKNVNFQLHALRKNGLHKRIAKKSPPPFVRATSISESGRAMLQIPVVFQHFPCHGHYYGRIWNWFVEKSGRPESSETLACWCLSVLWTAIPGSKIPQVLCKRTKIYEP